MKSFYEKLIKRQNCLHIKTKSMDWFLYDGNFGV